MATKTKKIKVGIIGCGAIGSRIAKSIPSQLNDSYELSGLYDLVEEKAKQLEDALGLKRKIKKSTKEVINGCDCVVEAVSSDKTEPIIREALRAKKHVLAMSVGRLINADDLFKLAQKNHCFLMMPSGAIAGLDALKAATLAGVYKIILTTRKPPQNLGDTPYLKSKGIKLNDIRKETLLFEGDVDTAVKAFPQNINVAATLALAAHGKEIMSVRILTSPKYTRNSHEVEVVGEFGRMVTCTENVPCPDNPKTSYLAVLSGIQTLKQLSETVKIGT